ncbi:hypothetical protein Tco_0787580 [Tanacetum coccineum]
MLRAFPVSLTGAASRWLKNQLSGSITTWEILKTKFKELLMKCPQHYLTDMQEVILFYNGLDVPTRQDLDSKGSMPFKTAADAKITFKRCCDTLEMAQWTSLGPDVLKTFVGACCYPSPTQQSRTRNKESK